MALFYGTGAMREEIEDQTLTYGFSRPVGRGWLYAARVLAAAVPVAVLAIPAAFFAGMGGPDAVRYAAGAALATVAYGSFFALVGQLIKWPAWFGLAFLVFWEAGVGQVPGFLGRLTLLNQVRGVTGLRPPATPWSAWWTPPDVAGAVVALLVVTAVTLWLGGQVVRRREVVLTK
jgi:ABC-2 type transport system permease protein